MVFFRNLNSSVISFCFFQIPLINSLRKNCLPFLEAIFDVQFCNNFQECFRHFFSGTPRTIALEVPLEFRKEFLWQVQNNSFGKSFGKFLSECFKIVIKNFSATFFWNSLLGIPLTTSSENSSAFIQHFFRNYVGKCTRNASGGLSQFFFRNLSFFYCYFGIYHFLFLRIVTAISSGPLQSYFQEFPRKFPSSFIFFQKLLWKLVQNPTVPSRISQDPKKLHREIQVLP